MDKVCFKQYIPSNKCEIVGYNQQSASVPAAKQPTTNSVKTSNNEGNKTRDWQLVLVLPQC